MGPSNGQKELLESSYKTCFKLVLEKNLRSVVSEKEQKCVFVYGPGERGVPCI